MSDDRGMIRPMRPAIRTVLGAEALEGDMAAAANDIHNKAIQMRTAARQDATIIVARARERGGASPTAWSAFDADAVHLITDLLLKLQGQEPTALDPSFRTRDDALASVSSMTGRIEEAIKREYRAEQILEKNSGRPQGVAVPQSDGSGPT
jgi:hypothetical protein